MGDDPCRRSDERFYEHQKIHEADDHPAFKNDDNDRHVYTCPGITVFKILFDVIAGLIQAQPTHDLLSHNNLIIDYSLA